MTIPAYDTPIPIPARIAVLKDAKKRYHDGRYVTTAIAEAANDAGFTHEIDHCILLDCVMYGFVPDLAPFNLAGVYLARYEQSHLRPAVTAKLDRAIAAMEAAE